MKPIVVLALALAVPAGGGAYPCPPIGGERVFADVPSGHPLCMEIESLFRDGLTSGCRVDEDGARYFCPDDRLTRAQAAAFSEHRDPFAQVNRDGRVGIGDHVVTADRFDRGHYWIQFARNILDCAREAWSQDLSGPWVSVHARVLNGTVDVIEVETKLSNQPIDMEFNLRLHCR